MEFRSPIDEKILVAQVTPEQTYLFDQELDERLTILWNTGAHATFVLDNKELQIEKNCVTFLTEFHKVEKLDFTQLNVIQFNRDFYCVREHDHETGCKGLLFYSTMTIPKFIIPEEKQRQFETLWEIFEFEMEEEDNMKIDMLRNLLKRFLILSLRIYKTQNTDLPIDDSSIALIREFNYLVEVNFRERTQVQDYAKLLHKSPKTISNVFKKTIDKTPLQLINNRRMQEARHQLRYSDMTIQEISDALNFKDVQAFPNFFKKRENISPNQFRTAINV